MEGEELQPLANGRYRLEEPLGMGGMATVYRAMDGALQVERAIKILAKELVTHQKLRTRFITEARTMARLRHPNVVTVFDVSVDESRPFIVMEMIEGGSLGDMIQRLDRLDVKLACELVQGALLGVQAAHDQGVVHRDLKPDNILITKEGVPKVTDFGIAHVEDLGMALTRTGTVMGTLAYMAPEQRSSARSADARSDVFAMGATLYVAVTGREPFDIYATNVQDELLQGIPEQVEQIIRKACQYRPDDRFSSADEMAQALAAVTSGLGEGLMVQSVVGAPMEPHDSKETISLGDLGAAGDDIDTRVLPSKGGQDPTFALGEEPPDGLSEPSFLLDSTSVPAPPPKKKSLPMVVAGLGLLLGLGGGGFWVAQNLDKETHRSSSSKSSEDRDDGDAASAEDPDEENRTPEDESAEAAPSVEASEPPEDASVDAQDEPVEAPVPGPLKPTTSHTTKTTSTTHSSTAPEASVEVEEDTEAASEEEAEVPVEVAVEVVTEPDVGTEPAAVGGVLYVNSNPQKSSVYVGGSFVGVVPVNHTVDSANVAVRVQSESGESRHVSLSFEGGETRRVFCDFESSDQCKVR